MLGPQTIARLNLMCAHVTAVLFLLPVFEILVILKLVQWLELPITVRLQHRLALLVLPVVFRADSHIFR